MRSMLALAVISLALASAASAQNEPTPAALSDAVHRFVSRSATPESCAPPVVAEGELRYTCATTDCPGGCQVVHVITVLSYRGGRFRRVSQQRQSRGDTGECGCCLSSDF